MRGFFVGCNYAGGDSRGDWTFSYYREFMHLHGFAFVGSQRDVPHNEALKAFRNCVQIVSGASKHPELVNAPYAATGLSAGGGQTDSYGFQFAASSRSRVLKLPRQIPVGFLSPDRPQRSVITGCDGRN